MQLEAFLQPQQMREFCVSCFQTYIYLNTVESINNWNFLKGFIENLKVVHFTRNPSIKTNPWKFLLMYIPHSSGEILDQLILLLRIVFLVEFHLRLKRVQVFVQNLLTIETLVLGTFWLMFPQILAPVHNIIVFT